MTKEHGVTERKKILESSYQKFLVSVKEEVMSSENEGVRVVRGF